MPYPIQFLTLRESNSLSSTAKLVEATVESLTPDGKDIVEITKAAERKAVIGVAGESQR